MTSATAISNDRRTFFLGVNTGYVADGVPDERFIEFYRRRASAKLHCAIVGNAVVPGGYGSNDTTPVLSANAIWGKIAMAIAEKQCIPGIQLATTWEGYVGARKFVSARPGQVIESAKALVGQIGINGARETLRAFDHACRIAVEHGFRHVQFHAAHGYLLSLLVDVRINPDAEEVLSGLAELAQRLTSSMVESSIRISLRTGDKVFDDDGAAYFQDRLAGLPFDYVDLSSGFYNIDKRLIYPSRPDVRTSRIEESTSVARRHPQRAFILSGLAGQGKALALPANTHLGLCRDLIANPDFLETSGDGCQNHGKCHYYSRGKRDLSCARWPVGN